MVECIKLYVIKNLNLPDVTLIASSIRLSCVLTEFVRKRSLFDIVLKYQFRDLPHPSSVLWFDYHHFFFDFINRNPRIEVIVVPLQFDHFFQNVFDPEDLLGCLLQLLLIEGDSVTSPLRSFMW